MATGESLMRSRTEALVLPQTLRTLATGEAKDHPAART